MRLRFFKQLDEIGRVLFVPVAVFVPFVYLIAFAVSLIAIFGKNETLFDASVKNKVLVVLQEITFHLREESPHCKILRSLSLDESCDVKLLVNAILTSLRARRFQATAKQPIAEVYPEQTSEWFSLTELCKLCIFRVRTIFFAGFFSENCWKNLVVTSISFAQVHDEVP